jgi:integrase/recombinase XerD
MSLSIQQAWGVSEVVGINVRDIMFNEPIMRVKGKGGKEWLAVFGPAAAVWLKRYLEEVRPVFVRRGDMRTVALFLARSGKRLSRKSIWKNYSLFAALVGTLSKLHTLRNSFATALFAGGAALRTVQELLGHTNMTTTQIYTHIDVSLLREKHRQYLSKLKNYES